MPYLERPWIIDESHFSEGTWIPERHLNEWEARGKDLPLREAWIQASGPTQEQEALLSNLGDKERDQYLKLLGQDIGNAQRDGMLYANFLEILKTDPSDAVADGVVDKMQRLGLASTSWPFAVGGPPPHESPRPWEKVLDWLLRLLANVSKFVMNCVHFAMVSLAPTGVSAVAVGVALPLSVSFEFPTQMFTQPRGAGWSRARTLLDGIIEEISTRAFSD